MSIEVSSAPQGTKPVSQADSQGKKLGKAGGATNGFAAMMNSLAATDASDGEVAADTLLGGQDDADSDALLAPLGTAASELALAMSPVVPQGFASDLSEGALAAMQLANPTVGAANSTDLAAMVKDVGQKATDVTGASLRSARQAADFGNFSKVATSSTADAAVGDGSGAGRAAADEALAMPVNTLLAHRNAAQMQTASAVQSDSKEVKASTTPQSLVTAVDASAPWLTGGMGELLVRPQGRFGTKSGLGQSGSSGFEGAFGQAMATAGGNRSDAVFEVPPASAVVPDTAVAETVSYWASHGVQTAELTLDGFGDTPVEVSILLNGDQAQIDFRTDQTDVRQILEGAAAHLKELLSSEGLQLSGVSVGSSGKGSTGEERKQRPGAQQITFAKVETLNPAVSRASNPAVGRSLDLFV